MSTLSMVRGDTKAFTATVTGFTGELDECTFKFTAKKRYKDADADAIIALSGGRILVTGASTVGWSVKGTDLPDAYAMLSTPATLLWDLQLTDPDDNVYTLDSGTLTLTPDVTLGS